MRRKSKKSKQAEMAWVPIYIQRIKRKLKEANAEAEKALKQYRKSRKKFRVK